MEKTKIDTLPLSFFRFLLAITIIYLHYGLGDYPHIKNYARAGSVIVFFYMVSGFVLLLNYRRKGEINLKQYLTKRVFGIAPLYYLGFILYLAILIYMDKISYLGVFLSAFGVQSWVINYQHYLNPPSWFVSGLLFFYLIFPFLFYRIKKAKPDARVLIVKSILVWLVSILILNFCLNPGFYSGRFSQYFDFIDSFPLAHFCSFFMGVCGAYYITEGKRHNYPEDSLKSVLSTLLVLILFLLSLTIHYQEDIGDFMQVWLPYEAGLYAPITLLLIINLSTEKNFMTRIFSYKIFIYLGSISYALYILQAPIYNIYLKFIAKPIGLEGVEEFLFFIFPYIFIAMAVTALEAKTIKKVYKKYFDQEAKRKISQDPTFGKRDQVFGSKTAE